MGYIINDLAGVAGRWYITFRYPRCTKEDEPWCHVALSCYTVVIFCRLMYKQLINLYGYFGKDVWTDERVGGTTGPNQGHQVLGWKERWLDIKCLVRREGGMYLGIVGKVWVIKSRVQRDNGYFMTTLVELFIDSKFL